MKRPVSYILFLCLFLMLPGKLLSQSLVYGNEWINYNQSYYKISVFEDGIYRLNYQDLINRGVPAIDPRRFQLFHRGREQAIFVSGQADGSWDNGDYIEFYGQRNDASLDVFLYNSANRLLNPFYNLYSDTTAYFLTWQSDGSPGKRMAQSNNQAVSRSQEAFQWEESVTEFHEFYNLGQNYNVGTREQIYDSFFDTGEGWSGVRVREGNRTNFEINYQNVYALDPSLTPTLEIKVVGEFESLSRYQALVEIGPNTSSYRSLTSIHEGISHNTSTILHPLTYADLSGSGSIQVRMSALRGDFRVVFARLRYPQQWQSSGVGDEIFGLIPKTFTDTSLVTINNVSTLNGLYDISDPNNVVKLSYNLNGANLETRIPHAQSLPSGAFTRSILVNRQAPLVPHRFESFRFENYDPSRYNYLIVTHPLLRSQTGSYNDPVQAYADYRSSPVGGSHQVLVANIDQLFNQFSFGERTPLAIRRFARYMYNNNRDIAYLFLIGKAASFPDNYLPITDPNFVDIRTDTLSSRVNLVPTLGFPPSDIAMVSGLNDNSKRVTTPDIAVGRIPAFRPDQVATYLDKVIEHEAADPALWQKNIIHLGGGNNEVEQRLFRGYLNEYEIIAENSLMGAQVSTTGKSTTSPIETVNISEQVNDGVGLITFFGHSALDVTDIEIGNVSDDIQGYENKGRYPLILTNGCQLGGIFYDTLRTTLSEDWIFTPDRGAVAFIAHCYLGFALPLSKYSRGYYTLLEEEDLIGKPIGVLMKETIRRNMDNGVLRDKSTAQQMILQGDPAVRSFKAELPDYETSNSRIFLESFSNEAISALTDSFKVNIVVNNVGAVTSDSLGVQVRRTFGDGSVEVYQTAVKYPAVIYQDTLSFVLYQNDSTRAFGNNTFEISLDHDQDIAEENENNNIGILEFFFPSVGVVPLTPLEYAIENGQPVTLSALASNLNENERAFIFEIDTSANYNSPAKQNATIPPGGVGNWDVTLLSDNDQDSTVYYWRVNYADAVNDPENLWGESSFTYIKSSPAGWTQRQFPQFTKDITQNAQLDLVNQRWEFQIQDEVVIEARTFGPADTTSRPNFIYTSIDGDTYISNPLRGDCRNNSLIVYRFTANGAIYPPPATATTACGRDNRAYAFTQTEIDAGEFDNYINNGLDGDYFLIFTLGRVAFSSFPQSIKAAFYQIGSNPEILNTLKDGFPYIIFGRKGVGAGTAIEVIPTSISNPELDLLQMKSAIRTYFEEANITSTVVGPATAWKDLRYNVEAQAIENYRLEIYGIDSLGIETSSPLPGFANIQSSPFDISVIDAGQYPRLRLKLNVKNEGENSMPQLKNWLVLYDGIPDGFIDVNAIGKSSYEISNKGEGEEFSLRFAFKNNSNLNFDADSLSVLVTLTNQSTFAQTVDTLKIKAPLPKETIFFSYDINTLSRGGNNQLRVFVNPREVPEIFFENNILDVDFVVDQDNTNPVLEVAIDGRQIIDGEIVSPSPLVSVVLRDNNKFLQNADRDNIIVFHKKPCETCEFEEVDLQQPEVNWVLEKSKSQVDFNLQELENGIHTLRVQGQDAVGNRAAAEPYSINFEVVNESTVTNFFPYPNPFSTSTRFVFTLTGREIPEKIKIQIMTVTGIVVREITQDEIGPIHIGNNLTEYAWDGRDEFGDPLANGVYLYRVLMTGTEDGLEKRQTSADKAFKNGFGKLYILR